MKHIEIADFGFGHNLMVPNCPDIISPSDFFEKVSNSEHFNASSFGLFDTASPNFNTYYPNLTPEQLQPKDEDFIYPVFRGLSEVIVRKRSYPVDFSKNGALQESGKKLVGQTIYNNHEMIIGNQLGVVDQVEWQEAIKLSKGVIPAGLNTRLKIDSKSHPNIARGILMEPPAIHSTSVTIEYAWEKSHQMADDEFYNRWGTFDKNGDLIRKVVTQVARYWEISLVAHGADPYAKKIGADGKIVLPEMAKSIDAQSEQRKKGNMYFFSFKDEDSFSEQNPVTIPVELIDNDDNTNIMKEKFLQLTKDLGIATLADCTDEQLVAAFSSHITELANSITGLKGEKETADSKVTELEGQISTLNASITELKKENPDLTATLNEMRAEATRLYELLEGPNHSGLDAFTSLNAKATLTELKATIASYQTKVDEKIPLTCKDCNSHSIHRASANPEGIEKPIKLTREDKLKSYTKANSIKTLDAVLGNTKN